MSEGKERDKAICVKAPEVTENLCWIPKSVIHDDSEVYGLGHEGKLVVYQWFADSKAW